MTLNRPTSAEHVSTEISREHMGQRLRKLRKSAGLTLKQLSERSGVTLPTLSKMELGQVSISYEKFVAIAKALDVDIGQLFRIQSITEPTRNPFKVVRCALSDAPLYASDHYAHRMLAVSYPAKTMMPIHGRIFSRSLEEFSGFGSHPGQEFIQVLSGSVRICFENGDFMDLKRTDSAYFDSGIGHVYLSLSRRPAEVLIVMTKEG